MTRSEVVCREAVAAYIAAIKPDLMLGIRREARRLGYAIAVHGSEARDLDLIAVPWVEDASSPDELVEAVVNATVSALGSGCLRSGLSPRAHGRQSATIVFHGPAFIDLSVTSRASS